MAERPVRIITKRTSVPNKIPTGTTGTELNLIKTGELASNLADKKLYSFDGSNVFEFGSNSFLGLTGGTISGDLNVTGTISASTYYNLPTLSGDYLPISGGTVTGNTVFTSGLTASTLSVDGLTQTSGITSTGGIIFPQKTISSTYTAQTEDYTIDVSGGTFTVYLPSAIGIQGKLYNIKNNGGGALTVQPYGLETIDDKPFVILGETNALQLVSNGYVWVALGYNISTVNSSTGVFEFTGLTKVSSTQFSVAPIKGWIVDDTTNPLSPQLYYIDYSGGTHTDNYVTTANETFVYLASGGTIQQQPTPLTSTQRRLNIFLGKLGHPDKAAINLVFSQPDFVLSPLAQLRDVFTPINLINGGVYPSANTGLTFNTSAGYIYGLGINFASDTLSPNSLLVNSTNPCTFQYRTQTGGTVTNVIDIDPTKYDVGGVITNITGTKASNQRIYLLQNGTIRVMYGQHVYNQFADAIQAIQTETFTPFPNFVNNAVLIGILTVLSTATDLTDDAKARFFLSSKFGETIGAAGGVSTTTLQQAYNNSSNPEITTNSTLDGVQIKGGTGNDNDKNIIIENNAGAQTAWITASGDSKFNSVSSNTISDVTTLSFNDLHTGTTAVGQLTWNTSEGTLSLGMLGGNVTQQIGLENYYQVINTIFPTGLTNGSVISSAGVDVTTGKIVGNYMIADGSQPYYVTLGIATEDILSGDTGYVNNFGVVRDIDTTGALYGETWLQGDILYVSPTIAGGLTNIVPESPNLKIQIALVLKVGVTDGTLFVKPELGYGLGDLHNTQTAGQVDGDLMFYSGASSTWVYGKTLPSNYVFNGSLQVNSLSASTYLNLPTDIRVTGFTYNDNNRITLSQNGTGSTLSVDLNVVSGLTSTGTIASSVLSASTYLNLPTDIYVTGGTYSSGTLTLDRQDGSVTITGFTTGGGSGSDIYVTGFTYNDNNRITLSQNGTGSTFNVDLNVVSGLTSTGTIASSVLSASTYLNLPTDIYVTGATYNDNNVFTFANSTGGTFSTSFDKVSGLTANGDMLVTGTTSASTFNIISVPNINTTSDSVLVRNVTTGDIESRSINSLRITNNTITVALTGSTGVDFNSIKAAVDSITGATSANTYTVKVSGGIYNEDPFRIPSWVAVVGDSSISTIINANDPSQTLIQLSDQSALFDSQVQGCTDTGVSAIVYSSSTTPQSSAISYVENVRFGSNYTHAKVVAYGGANIIMQCSNVKYGGYPFTIGFYATNNVSGVGRMQLRNVTSTNGGIATTSGLIFAKADAPSCGFIVNGCLLTKAVGAAAGTGFYVENGGFLRLTAVNFQRWSTGIYAPQIGSAPSIDAIALNFENCTTDVSIIHSGATGKVQGTDNFLKTQIEIDAPLYEVGQDPRVISVAKKGGDFSSIKSAIDYLIASATTSIDSRYVIEVGPGQFVEDEIDLTSTPYVSIVGSNIQTTQILPRTNTQHIIKLGQNNEISFLSLSGAPSGYAGIYCYDIGDFGQAHKVSLYDCDTNVWVESSAQECIFYGEYLDFNGTYTYGTKVLSSSNLLALANLENYYNFPESTGITHCNYASGSGATLSVFVGDCQSNGVSGSTGYYIQDGASLNASTITIDGFTYGIYNPNVGDGITFDVDNASIVNGEWDLYVERTTTFGTFAGSSNHEKIFTQSTDVYWSFLDINDGEFDITRKASVTFADGTHTDFTTLIFEGSTMGLIDGGNITLVSGLTINVSSGFGYLAKTLTPEIHKRIDWTSTNLVLTSGSSEHIYFNENGTLSTSGGKPSTINNILLGRVVTNETTIEFIDESPMVANHTSNRFDALFSEAMGPIFATGSIVTEGTTGFTLDVSNGEYYFSTNQYLPSGGSGITFNQYYRNGTGSTWISSATTIVNNTQWDNNGTLSALTTGYYTKHTLYLLGEDANEEYFLVLGQNQYSTLVEVENALLPTPPTYFTDSVTQVANIYIQQGTSNIIEIEDIRPTIAFRAGGVNASSVHGNLLGLDADDHIQYLLVDGGRAMAGNLDMGSNDITNVGNVDGVDVSAHATRHQFGGADPVGTVTPSANAIPYADVSGKLDEWISSATTTTRGLVKMSVNPTTAGNPIAVGLNDPGYTNAFTATTYSANTLTSTRNDGTTSSTTIGLRTKANSVAGASFAGNPKKFTVTFTTAYPNTNYSISIMGGINRTFTYESKTTTGFVINANSNTAFVENVDWMTIAHGES